MSTTRTWAPKPVRTYTLPSTSDERGKLITGLRRMTEIFFGYPARSANVAVWSQLSLNELARIHGNWVRLMEKVNKETLF